MGRQEGMAVNARLTEAAESSEPVELILVLRGKLGRARGSRADRWRMRSQRRHVVTFDAAAVIACTPVRRPVHERVYT